MILSAFRLSSAMTLLMFEVFSLPSMTFNLARLIAARIWDSVIFRQPFLFMNACQIGAPYDREYLFGGPLPLFLRETPKQSH